MARRATAISLVLLLLAALGAGTARGQAAPVGTSETRLELADISIDGLPVDRLWLGGSQTFASTDPDPAHNTLGQGADFALALVSLATETILEARSDGTTSQQGQTISLPAGIGSVSAGALRAVTDGEAAEALIDLLSGSVDILGLQAQSSGVTSTVDATAATATNGAVLQNLSLGLTDLLPRDVLEQLPLDVLLGLLDGLGLNLDLGGLTALLGDVRNAVDLMGTVESLMGQIDDAQSELEQLVAELAAATALVTQLEGTVSSLESQLTTAQTERSALLSQLAGLDCSLPLVGPLCDSLQAQIGALDATIAGLQGQLTTATADLLDAQATVTTLNGLVDEAQATLTALVAELDDVLTQLLDLLSGLDLARLPLLLDALIDGLAGVQLISLDRLSVGLDTHADATSSRASALCSVSGLVVVGQTVADTCQALAGAVGQLTSLLNDTLAALPLVGSLPGVSVQGPQLVTSPDNHMVGDYFTALASIRGFALSVDGFELTQAADTLLADVQAFIDQTLADLAGITGLSVDVSVLDTVLDALRDALAALPLGDLGGVSLPGLQVAALNLGAQSEFLAAAVTPPPPAPPATPPAAPGTPGTGTGTPTLPVTGGGLGLALALMAAGGGAAWWSRRPRASSDA